MAKDGKSEANIPVPIKFLFGGLSNCGAVCVSHPLDMLKTRMQVSGEMGTKQEFDGITGLVRQIIKSDGITGLYAGVTASWLRQATYGTTRLGTYNWFKDLMAGPNGKTSGIGILTSGILSGLLASFVGLPADVSLTRMAADNRLPPAQRRNYKHVFDALIRISREEGIMALTTGATPTIIRAIISNTTQLGSYSEFKNIALESGLEDNIYCHLICSFAASLVSTTSILPADIAKVRLQNMKRSAKGELPYSGFGDVMMKTIRHEGIFALWKGFLPAYIRNGPHTICMFVILENLNAFYINKFL